MCRYDSLAEQTASTQYKEITSSNTQMRDEQFVENVIIEDKLRLRCTRARFYQLRAVQQIQKVGFEGAKTIGKHFHLL
jgi:hypothetical protein